VIFSIKDEKDPGFMRKKGADEKIVMTVAKARLLHRPSFMNTGMRIAVCDFRRTLAIHAPSPLPVSPRA
jgi:hypothetical protein